MTLGAHSQVGSKEASSRFLVAAHDNWPSANFLLLNVKDQKTISGGYGAEVRAIPGDPNNLIATQAKTSWIANGTDAQTSRHHFLALILGLTRTFFWVLIVAHVP